MPLACGQSRGDRQSLAHHPTSLIGLPTASRHVAEVSGSSVVSLQLCSDRRVASTPALLSLSPHALSSHLLMELNLINNYIACVSYASSLLLGGSRGCKPTRAWCYRVCLGRGTVRGAGCLSWAVKDTGPFAETGTSVCVCGGGQGGKLMEEAD